ncbi:hypothetical protein [Streptomyces sp. NPDC051286]|uniref:hypothetical protein n=1 Tax=Streptomyces sp. NPDC051286 TaxID=3365647 RepID=UPI00378BD8E0
MAPIIAFTSHDVSSFWELASGLRGVRRFTEPVAAEPTLTATALQTVGSKGCDGLMIALVTGGR